MEKTGLNWMSTLREILQKNTTYMHKQTWKCMGKYFIHFKITHRENSPQTRFQSLVFQQWIENFCKIMVFLFLNQETWVRFRNSWCWFPSFNYCFPFKRVNNKLNPNPPYSNNYKLFVAFPRQFISLVDVHNLDPGLRLNPRLVWNLLKDMKALK